MAHPLATKAISSARVKNDKVDAKTLAHLLRTNLLPEAWAAPPEVRDARKLARTRVSLARISSRVPDPRASRRPSDRPTGDRRVRARRASLPRGGGTAPPHSPGSPSGQPAADRPARPRARPGRAGTAGALPSRSSHPKAHPHPRDRLHHRGPDRGRGLGRVSLPLSTAPVLVGRAYPHRALQRRPHAQRPHLQAGLAVAPMGDGGVGLPPVPQGPHPSGVPRWHRPPTRRQDRQGRPRPAAAHAVLLRASRRTRVPRVPGTPNENQTSQPWSGALAAGHGLLRDGRPF